MGGGYQGEGFKTVIPAAASAKVSFRLVFEQDPDEVREAFRAFVKARIPQDCDVEFIAHSGGRATVFDTSGPFFRKTQAALTAEWGRDAAFIGSGGSIPVTNDIVGLFGMPVVMAGFGLADDRIHSPNEKYDLRSFHKGARSWARILGALAD
jgi:acetylornithine deacetylase/succinyl-diaminopimelate desuccinylase-like protein